MPELTEPQGGLTEVEGIAIRNSLVERRSRLRSIPPGDGASRLAGLLTEVDAALDRLESGTFGLCTRCDGRVERDRIFADPLVEVCLDCLTDAERAALQRDLELASRIQAGLLPPRELGAAGWTARYAYHPHGAVSGDYVDVILPQAPEGDVLVMVGDVSGKGVAAALLMSHLHAVFRATAGQGTSLREMVSRANSILYASTTAGLYATLVAVRLAPNGRAELCTAGHPPALLLSSSGIHKVATEGVPLGLFADANFDSLSVDLGVGDGLLLYTDGVTETTASDETELGVDGLQRELAGCVGCTPSEVVDRVLGVIDRRRQGPGHDDVTIMALRRMA